MRRCMLFAIVASFAIGATSAGAQQGSVAGTVVESRTFKPLAGAQVLVEGQGRGVLTDANGRFRISGLSGADVSIQVVMLGYRARTQQARVNDANVRIALDEAAVELNEIVVTGTAGGVQKRALGNSVARIKAADVAQTAPIRSMQELINGRAPGVVVMPGTGMVGSGSKIRIRGQSTFSLSQEPLIFVDGVRVNNEQGSGSSIQGFGSGVVSRLNDFNPSEIESIEILKGAAAATLYGSEAGRGVINIITKKGTPGSGARYSFSVRGGANWLSNPEAKWPTNYWKDPSGQIQSLNMLVSENERGTPVFRTGAIQGYTAQVSGGVETTRYFISAEVSDQEGAERNNNREQFSGRANLQIVPNSKMDISVSTGYVKSSTDLSCEAGCGGAMWTTIFSTPQFLSRNCTASSTFGCGFSRGGRSWTPETYYLWTINQDINRFTGSVLANWKPLSWLTHRLTVGTDLTDEQNEEYLPYLTNDTARFFWASSAQGFKYQTRRVQNFNTYDYSGTANLNLRPNLVSTTSLGVQYYQRHIEFIGAQGNDFPAPGFETVASAARPTFTSDDYLDNNSVGVFAQQQFALNERLYFTGALRVDNNSAFGADLDWVTYPKASVSWVATEEPMVRDRLPDLFNSLRLRLAYGESGQQPVAFSALRTYTPAVGPNNTPAISPNSVGNPELGPERSKEIEVGFDAGLLNDRLGLEFTYFNTNTVDAILSRQIAPSVGFAGSQLINAGQINNYGFEALARAQVISGERNALDLVISAAWNGGKVKKLIGNDTTIVSGDIQHKIGYPAWSWFRERVVSAEYDRATDQVRNVMCDDGKGGTMPCFLNNVFGGQVVAPRVFLGRTVPAFEASLQPTLKLFRHVRLSGLLDMKTGFKKFDNNLRARCQVFRVCMENINPQDYDPVFIAQMRTNNTLKDWVLRDGSFVKLREIAATFDVPENLVSRAGARGLTINVAARNLRTWTDYTGLDPEAMFLSGGTSFLEQDNLPQLMSLITTISVHF